MIAILTVGLTASSIFGRAAQTSVGSQDAQIQADVLKALNKKQFQDVKVTSQNGVVTLSGTVALYADKQDADNKTHRRKNVKGVDNEIVVAGPAVDDATLRDELMKKISYDRAGYGTLPFNAFTVDVQSGVVTLGGVAYGPTDKGSALSLAAYYPGVKDVIDNIDVAPVSRMDDRIRIAALRSIYGATPLNKYFLNPAKPIRITVVNGNIVLSGVVDSESDKTVAGLRANSVPGGFKVVNNLQVQKSAPKK